MHSILIGCKKSSSNFRFRAASSFCVLARVISAKAARNMLHFQESLKLKYIRGNILHWKNMGMYSIKISKTKWGLLFESTFSKFDYRYVVQTPNSQKLNVNLLPKLLMSKSILKYFLSAIIFTDVSKVEPAKFEIFLKLIILYLLYG